MPEWPEIDAGEGALTVWGVGGSRLRVEIDGTVQDSFSARHAAPELGPLTSRKFVEIGFAAFPSARPGGTPRYPVPRRGWFARLLRPR